MGTKDITFQGRTDVDYLLFILVSSFCVYVIYVWTFPLMEYYASTKTESSNLGLLVREELWTWSGPSHHFVYLLPTEQNNYSGYLEMHLK